MLRTPEQLAAVYNSHGQRPFSYVVEFAPDPKPEDFSSNGWMWGERLVKLDSIQLGYGAEAYPARFTMWDELSTEAPHFKDDTVKHLMMMPPRVGEIVRIWGTDPFVKMAAGNIDAKLVIFEGVVRSVHERKSDDGLTYMVEAGSHVARLNDVGVTFSANLRNDPINPVPRFDPDGTVYYEKIKTVAQIIRDIMNFKDAWNTSEYFSYDDIDWNGLETDPRCGGYKPTQIIFSNTPKGQAIQEVLSRAGNYTFIYVPYTPTGIVNRTGKGKLKIVEINLSCNRVGDEWPITWPVGDTGDGTAYAYECEVQEDLTQWSSVQTANVCRIMSGPIRFYSGNWMIPEILDGDGYANVRELPGDTTDSQISRAISPDGTNYRFTFPMHTTEDRRQYKQYPVGIPLFPDWNIHEDFMPATHEIFDVIMPPSGIIVRTSGGKVMEAADYRGLVEFESFSIGDQVARGEQRLGHIDNLRVYQAWMPGQACRACEGSGLVDKVYTNEANEPEIQFYIAGPSGERTLEPTEIPASGEKIYWRVANYIMNPSDFGNCAAPPEGLTPFAGAGYPLPWKNLCPYCRGVGIEPKYRLRNIQPLLFAGRNNQTSPSGQVNEIPLDPDTTQVNPESWEESVGRVTIRQDPQLQVEVPLLGTSLPEYGFRNTSFDDMKKTATATQRRNLFPHPLQFTSLQKRLAGLFGITGADAKVTPDNWKAEVPYTTVSMVAPPYRIDFQMGRVIFEEPLFVPCRKEFTAYLAVENHKLRVQNNGMLMPRTPGRGTVMADRFERPTGYWRPARVWMMFFYCRDNYYRYMFNATPARFQVANPEGQQIWYQAQAAIYDGALALEVRQEPDTQTVGAPTYVTGNRLIQTSITDPQAWVETTEDDLNRLTMPGAADVEPPMVEQIKNNAGCLFARGRLLRMERTTPGEVMAEMAGYVAADYQASLMRPKLFSFRLRDDRSSMLAKAIRRLEMTNNLNVNGSLTVTGRFFDISNGLGYVQFPDEYIPMPEGAMRRTRAVVKKIEYTFGQGMDAKLELSREEGRIGETLPDDAEKMHDIEKDVIELKRLTAADTVQHNTASLQDSSGIGSGTMFYRGG